MPVDIITKSASDVITEVTKIFGDESGTQITSSDIVRWINAAQLEVAMRSPEILPAAVLINSQAGQADYPLLANVPDVLTVQSIHFKNVPVKHMTFQEAEEYLMKGDTLTEPSESPMFWYERAGVVTFYPAPASAEAGAIKVYYNKRPAAVTDAGSLLSLSDHYYGGIIAYVLEQAYLMDENPQLAGVVAAKFDSTVTRMSERTQTQSDAYPFITVVEDY